MTFTVSPNLPDRTVNYITVGISPSGSFAGQRVDGAPLILRIATTPDTNSFQECRTTSSSVNGTTTGGTVSVGGLVVVRAGDTLTCLVQGRVALPNTSPVVLQPVQSFGDSYIMITMTNDDPSTVSEIQLPEFAPDLNGLFTMPIIVPSASLATTLTVATMLRYVAGTPYLTRAPQRYAVVASPLNVPTAVTCRSVATGSTTLFAPMEAISCSFASTAGARLLSNDVAMGATAGAVITSQIAGGAIGTTFAFSAAAGPRQSFATTAAGRDFSPQNSATPVGNAVFSIVSNFAPTGAAFGTTTLKLIYVAAGSAVGGLYPAGGVTRLSLVGSNLGADNVYVISPTLTCNTTGVSTPPVSATNFVANGAVNDPSAATTGLTLAFSTPSFAPFYVCVRPTDASFPALLTSQSFHNGTDGNAVVTRPTGVDDGSDSGMSTDDLILLIVGLSLILLFLIILLIVCCCIRRNRAAAVTRVNVVNRDNNNNNKGTARVNDQFVFSGIGGAPNNMNNVSVYNQSHLSRMNNSVQQGQGYGYGMPPPPNAYAAATYGGYNGQNNRSSSQHIVVGSGGPNTPRVHQFGETPEPARRRPKNNNSDEEENNEMRQQPPSPPTPRDGKKEKKRSSNKDKRSKKEKRSGGKKSRQEEESRDDNNNNNNDYSDAEGDVRPQAPPPPRRRTSPSDDSSNSDDSDSGGSSPSQRRKQKERRRTSSSKQRRGSNANVANPMAGGGGGITQVTHTHFYSTEEVTTGGANGGSNNVNTAYINGNNNGSGQFQQSLPVASPLPPHQTQFQQSLPPMAAATGTAYNYGGSYAVRGHSSTNAPAPQQQQPNSGLTQHNLSNYGGGGNANANNNNPSSRGSVGTGNGGRQAVNSAHPALRMNAIEDN